MENDDAEARRKRAAKLREQIADITGKRQNAPTGQQEGTPSQDQTGRRSVPRVSPLSPRDFIERRMRELDRGTDKDSGKGDDSKT